MRPSKPLISGLLFAALTLPALADTRTVSRDAANVRSGPSAPAQRAAPEDRRAAPTYGFSQSATVFEFSGESASSYGHGTTTVPQTGTSYSFPAETYAPIEPDAPSFGLKIRF